MDVRFQDASHISVSFDETHTVADVEALVEGITSVTSRYGLKELSGGEIAVDGAIPAAFARTTPFLTQKIYNSIRSETDMLRHMYGLQMKDLSLNTSMITLGSCTMKLNSTSSMIPCSWEAVANVHPFAPSAS